MTTKLTTTVPDDLPGFDAKAKQQLAAAVDYIINTCAADLQEALGSELDNEAMFDTVRDHLHDYRELYRNCSAPDLDRETLDRWLATAPKYQWAWYAKHFNYFG